VTILEKEKEEIKQKQLEYEQKKLAEERRRATLRVIYSYIFEVLNNFVTSCYFK